VLAIASTRVASDKIGKVALQSGNTSAFRSGCPLASKISAIPVYSFF
jgi:hypothetical protein